MSRNQCLNGYRGRKAEAAARGKQAVWARSGAWPPRAQTGKGENLTLSPPIMPPEP
jgi:hypothetical protein